MPSPRDTADRLQAARLHGMAEMARALGHEVNNILAAIVLRLEMLAEDVPPDGPARESVGMVDEATRQGVALVRRVGDLARLSRPLVPRPVDLAGAVADALEALRAPRAARPGVQIAMDHQAALVSGDRAELAVAVRELVANALEAAAGRVRIETRVDGTAVCCRIVDDGPGVTPEAAVRAFEPFFTTSGERGRGLGLTIALGVAARHDGGVELGPVDGGGSVATLRLPRAR